MDCRTNSDIFFLTEEKFDFDVCLSPDSSTCDEDEDEVFMGPVTHKEKSVSVNMTSQVEDSNSCVQMSWSPLIGDQLDAVCQEAHRLATQLQSSRQKSNDDETASKTSDTTNPKEEFVQDAEAKLDVICQAARVLSPIKRETFCVQDSPMKQLPPAVQRRLLRGSSNNVASSNRSSAISKAPATRRSMATTTNAAVATRSSARLSTSSPVVAAKTQPRTSLRGRASISVGVVLPSKPTAPTTSCSASKTRVDKTRLQPPSKVVAGRRRSPMSRSTSRAESYEDLLSDSTSVASDLSDCSLNSSLVGKRTLGPPTKRAVRNLPGVKAPPPQNRRNTSSSSSSVSSFNSSLSVSPAKGKLNSSLNRSLSGSTCPAPSSIGRPASHSRTRRSITHTVADPVPSNPGRRSISTQARKLSETERLKTIKSTPLKRAPTTQLQTTPAKRVMERTTSIPPTALVRPQSALKAKPKPEAQVVPTPSEGVKGVSGVSQINSVSSMLKPKRLVSANSTDSLPQRSTAGPLTPSAGGVRSLQMKPRRPSALPTPVRHRMSSIATPTSTNPTRSQRPPFTAANNDPGSVRKESGCSSASPARMEEEKQEEEPVDVPEIQPFSLEEEQPPAAPVCITPEPNQSEDTNSEAPCLVQSGPTKNLLELETAEQSNSKVLLLDLPAPVLQPQEKLLIDLTNTPDLIRTSAKCVAATQLIDLSSPLIKWSPEDKRENNAPLINISF